MLMNTREEQFNEMLDWIVRIVELFKDTHERGVDFGTGDRLFPAEIHTLEAIEDGKGRTVTALAEYFDVSKATISERIKKLAQRELLQKVRVAGSKEVAIELTEKGLVAYAGHQAHHERMFHAFAKQFDDDFEQVLENMTRAFKTYYKAVGKISREGLLDTKHGPK